MNKKDAIFSMAILSSLVYSSYYSYNFYTFSKETSSNLSEIRSNYERNKWQFQDIDRRMRGIDEEVHYYDFLMAKKILSKVWYDVSFWEYYKMWWVDWTEIIMYNRSDDVYIKVNTKLGIIERNYTF